MTASEFPSPDPTAPVLADLARLTDKHEEDGRDATVIASAISTYLRHYMDQRGVPLGVALIPHKGQIG
jgi:hypothetical protein